MLNSYLKQESAFDELMQDAFAQIPLITKDWTNFNPSEPAVTVLESISMMTLVQQSYINRLPKLVQEKLYGMAGLKRIQGKSARVLIEAENVSEGLTMPAGQRFRVGALSFETNREQHLGTERILGVFTKNGDKLNDISYILDPDIPLRADVFTDEPMPGMELYIVCSGLTEAKSELLFYMGLEESIRRNPMEQGQSFSQIRWQVYTEQGFTDIHVNDRTEGLLISGELRFRMPLKKPKIYEGLPIQGYVIRGTLKEADYDLPPRLISLNGFLFEAWQRQTGSLCYTFGGTENVKLYSDILEDGYWQIFCREDEEGFRLYNSDPSGTEKGRYYRAVKLGNGCYRILFDKETRGYGPSDQNNAVKLVAYSEDVMQQYYLGMVYGYDNQKIRLPYTNILEESFSLITKRKDSNGEDIYDFIKPGSEKKDTLYYRFDEDNAGICIIDPGDYVGAELYVCSLASYEGSKGNIRSGSNFIPSGYETDIRFTNPADGTGGRFTETLDELKARFLADLNNHYTAVEAGDYEKIVKTTPGLCIHQVKAYLNSEKNCVTVAVKPYGRGNTPKLTRTYREILSKRINERRLLSTNVEIVDPKYIPVNVYGTVYVKPHFEKSREQIIETIRKKLDYPALDKDFGQVLHFDELFHSIEALDCVMLIYELNAVSDDPTQAVRQGLDIVPSNECLLIPGRIEIETVTMGMNIN